MHMDVVIVSLLISIVYPTDNFYPVIILITVTSISWVVWNLAYAALKQQFHYLSFSPNERAGYFYLAKHTTWSYELQILEKIIIFYFFGCPAKK